VKNRKSKPVKSGGGEPGGAYVAREQWSRGTRGIGEAISKSLEGAGYKVAATTPATMRAQKFKSATGIPVYKWDVSNYDAVLRD
jgi:hypothetical protein